MNSRTVVIALARCTVTKKGYGVRLECQDANHWVATWSFAIKEDVARREGYEKTQMSGSFGTRSDWPGCPFCSAKGFFRCTCGKLACWNGETDASVCPSCGQRVVLGGELTSLEVGIDR
jgi:hypothetical protein